MFLVFLTLFSTFRTMTSDTVGMAREYARRDDGGGGTATTDDDGGGTASPPPTAGTGTGAGPDGSPRSPGDSPPPGGSTSPPPPPPPARFLFFPDGSGDVGPGRAAG